MMKSYEELLADMTGIIAKIYEKGFDKGYEQGKFDAAMDSAIEKYDGALRKMAEETPQQKRDRIIEKAKKDIEELRTTYLSTCEGLKVSFWPKESEEYGFFHIHNVDFIINTDKRTVVALIKTIDNEVDYRGIAKAHPNDCFNVHIGKAIALRRALGLEVPDEYLNAPQPTEVRVGDKVRISFAEDYKPGEYFEEIVTGIDNGWVDTIYEFPLGSSTMCAKDGDKIIDDSREEASK